MQQKFKITKIHDFGTNGKRLEGYSIPDPLSENGRGDFQNDEMSSSQAFITFFEGSNIENLGLKEGDNILLTVNKL